jgi:hypothetical protein
MYLRTFSGAGAIRLASPLVTLAMVSVVGGTAAPTARAQQPSARIEGTVRDSVHERPLVGAAMLLSSITRPGSKLSIVLSDDRGRFRFDTLVPGRYTIELLHPILGSLELALPARELTLGTGEQARLEMGIPSATTLRAGACPGLRLARDTGAVVGRAVDADTDTPLTDARVVVAWSDLLVDRATLRPESRTRTGSVPVDSLGRYRLCGVPTDTYLQIQLQAHGRASTTLRVNVPSDAGVAVRHLSLSASTAPLIASIDSAPAAPRTGTATLTGVVLGAGSRPVAGAQLGVLGTVGTTRSDSAGHFSLSDLPAGTHVLEVRQIGYLLTEHPLELRSGRTVDASVRLSRIVSLDSIRIVARRSMYADFERRRRSSAGFGRFMNEEEIAERHASEVSDFLRMMPGFQVRGLGLDAKVTSGRGQMSVLGGECQTNIVIDGNQHQNINLILPWDVGTLEAYAGPAGAPVMYDSTCGVIVITTKR